MAKPTDGNPWEPDALNAVECDYTDTESRGLLRLSGEQMSQVLRFFPQRLHLPVQRLASRAELGENLLAVVLDRLGPGFPQRLGRLRLSIRSEEVGASSEDCIFRGTESIGSICSMSVPGTSACNSENFRAVTKTRVSSEPTNLL